MFKVIDLGLYWQQFYLLGSSVFQRLGIMRGTDLEFLAIDFKITNYFFTKILYLLLD